MYLSCVCALFQYIMTTGNVLFCVVVIAVGVGATLSAASPADHRAQRSVTAGRDSAMSNELTAEIDWLREKTAQV